MNQLIKKLIVRVLRVLRLHGAAKRAQENVLTVIARRRASAARNRFFRVHSVLIDSDENLEARLYKDTWLVSRVDESTSPKATMTLNRERLEGILDHAAIAYRRIPIESSNRFRVAVIDEDRASVWTALVESALANSYLYADLKSDPAPVNLATWGAALPGIEFDEASVWRYFECVSSRGTDLTMGDLFGCEIEFWTREDDALVASRWNRMITRVSLEGFSERAPEGLPFFDEPLFPVDVVFTWVDGDDPKWLAQKNHALRAIGAAPVSDAGHDSRFVNRDELKSALRSLETYADFVRQVYVVTADQVPPWLRPTDRLTIVDHREIIPEEVLPTFNSHVIEARLHQIQGLSEHFIYMNDDFLFGRRVAKDQFFSGNGLSKFFLSRALISGNPDLTVDRAAQNSQQLVREAFGRIVTQKFKHAPYSLRRSVLFEIEERFPEIVERTLKATFRSPTDLPIASSFHHYYGYMTGHAIPDDVQSRYIDVGGELFEIEAARLVRLRNYDTLCVNDGGEIVTEVRDAAIREFLHELQPNAASWEQAGLHLSDKPGGFAVDGSGRS